MPSKHSDKEGIAIMEVVSITIMEVASIAIIEIASIAIMELKQRPWRNIDWQSEAFT